MSCSNKTEVKKCYKTAHRIAYTIEKYSGEFDRRLKNALGNLNKVMSRTGNIKDAERKGIGPAVGCKQGHWYKCCNEHIYVITVLRSSAENVMLWV
jgi:hypothetical protein